MDEKKSRIAVLGARRFSKSVFMATQVALAIKNGRRITLNGEDVVGVPGFDDGRQLPPSPISTTEGGE